MHQPDISNTDVNPPWNWEPLTHSTGVLAERGDPRAPEYGPGFELSAGEPRPAMHDLTFGIREQGAWMPDEMSGVHGVIGTLEADHYGYQQPWDIQMPIDRSAPVGSWDEGIQGSSSTGGWV